MAKIIWRKQSEIDAEREQAREQEEQTRQQEAAQKQLINLLAANFLKSEDLTEEQKQTFLAVYDPWRPGQAYAAGDKVHHDGKVYEVIQSHTSQADWKPVDVPALFKVFYQREAEDETGTPVEVIPEWVQPTGGHDAYNQGDRVTYKGTVYESTINGNVWSPTAHPAGWKEVTPS